MSKKSQAREAKEGLRHREAFQYYYGLGDSRSLADVAKQYKVAHNTAKTWSVQFNWQQRVVQNDIEIGRKLEKKQINEIVSTKAKYRKELDEHRLINRHLIIEAAKAMQSGDKTDIKVKSLTQLARIMEVYEKIVKLDMLLLNEYQSAGVDEKNMQVIIYQPVKETEEESVDASDLEKESE